MNRMRFAVLVSPIFVLILVAAEAPRTWAEDNKTPYPSMAPLDQYLMERSAEIALARSAAPESISRDAEVRVLGQHGYETVAKGKNGFVCVVQRSWIAPFDDPGFWNPKGRAPICLNAPAARSYLPLILKRTELVLAGRSKAQMFGDLKAAVDRKELPAMEFGAMCYMMSKQAYLSDSDPRWHPHLMFFAPLTDPAAWGADLAGSPILAFNGKDNPEPITVFLIPVGRWSDGTAAPADAQ